MRCYVDLERKKRSIGFLCYVDHKFVLPFSKSNAEFHGHSTKMKLRKLVKVLSAG